MSLHEPMTYFGDMLDHAREAHALATSIERETLDRDRIKMLAATRLIEIIGEAANRIPKDVRYQHPSINWPDIINMRNRIVHGYSNINLDIVWSVLIDELPGLIVYLETFVPEPPTD